MFIYLSISMKQYQNILSISVDSTSNFEEHWLAVPLKHSQQKPIKRKDINFQDIMYYMRQTCNSSFNYFTSLSCESMFQSRENALSLQFDMVSVSEIIESSNSFICKKWCSKTQRQFHSLTHQQCSRNCLTLTIILFLLQAKAGLASFIRAF
jgi:hypothetical protein